MISELILIQYWKIFFVGIHFLDPFFGVEIIERQYFHVHASVSFFWVRLNQIAFGLVLVLKN